MARLNAQESKLAFDGSEIPKFGLQRSRSFVPEITFRLYFPTSLFLVVASSPHQPTDLWILATPVHFDLPVYPCFALLDAHPFLPLMVF